MPTTYSLMKLRLAPLSAALALAGLAVLAPPAAAHTEADVVAVPAGSQATITFQPTHGCGSASTVEVDVQAPVGGATPTAVAGWTESATPGTDDTTTVSWKGGVLPTSASGAFPITFTAPDTVGELLVFPAVQVCENGEELAWIDGDPDGEYPAPRVLVLPAGASPASSIDDVPTDAPGRELLSEVVDVDNPGIDATTDESSNSSVAPPTSTTSTGATDAAPTTTTAAEVESSEDGTSPVVWFAVAAAIVVLGGAAFFFARRNSSGR